MSVLFVVESRIAWNTVLHWPTNRPTILHLSRHFTCSSIASLTKYQKSLKRAREGTPSQTKAATQNIASKQEVQVADKTSSTRLESRLSATTKPGQISFELTKPFPEQDLSSTRPAKLNTPEILNPAQFGGVVPASERVKYLYRLGRAYLSFYKTGLKNVWSNYKECQVIKQRLGGRSITDVAKYGFPDGEPISRRDYQLYLRTKHDIGKLIPFSLIFLICGEFTPLVVLALGSRVVPATCRIPKQVTSDRIRLAERWLEPRIIPSDGAANAVLVFDLDAKGDSEPAYNSTRPNDHVDPPYRDLKIPARKVLVAKDAISVVDECAAHSAIGSVEGSIKPLGPKLAGRLGKLETRTAYLWGLSRVPVPPAAALEWLFTKVVSSRRLKRRAEEVLCDAILICREGGLARLEDDEFILWASSYNSAMMAQLLIKAKNTRLDLDKAFPPPEAKACFVREFGDDVDAMFLALRSIEHEPKMHYLAALVRSEEHLSMYDKAVGGRSRCQA